MWTCRWQRHLYSGQVRCAALVAATRAVGLVGIHLLVLLLRTRWTILHPSMWCDAMSVRDQRRRGAMPSCQPPGTKRLQGPKNVGGNSRSIQIVCLSVALRSLSRAEHRPSTPIVQQLSHQTVMFSVSAKETMCFL